MFVAGFLEIIRVMSPVSVNLVLFFALFNGRKIGRCEAYKGGSIQWVQTNSAFERCGLAKYLTEASMKDELVGSYDPNKELPQGNPFMELEERKEEANRYCERLIIITCGSTTPIGCSAYISASERAGYSLMWTNQKVKHG